MQLKGLTPGNYVVNVTYNGDNKHNGNDTSQNIEFKENKAVEASSQSSSTSSQSSSTPYDINNLPPTNDPYPETKRYYVDQYYVKQEFADGYMRTVDIRNGKIYSNGFK